MFCAGCVRRPSSQAERETMKPLIALTQELLADTDTPVSAYMKLCAKEADSFLFESGEPVESIGRYSIVAWDPLATLTMDHQKVRLVNGGQPREEPMTQFIDLARRAMAELSCQSLPPLPFVGSLMGYVGYDAVRVIEPCLLPAPSQDIPIARLCYSSRFAVFDHLKRSLTLVAICRDEAEGRAKLKEMVERLHAPVDMRLEQSPPPQVQDPPRQGFLDAVKKAKQYIVEGDIFQVVLSDRFQAKSSLDPFSVYRWLRVKSPSPYMFFLNMAGFKLVGSSPETLVKVEDGQVLIRPIAGTRNRDPLRDDELERELMASEKERAEHVMLVDLARNDAGRVSSYGTVTVNPYMIVERFSHVMHITSQVQGTLRPELDVWDAFAAGFPAGTLSGAPKVRAMEIIDELERTPRGVYGGAVGSFGPGRRMDTCIAIRMIQFQGDNLLLQSGAGIVADSIPEMEYEEIQHKAAQGVAALGLAARGM